MITRTAVGITRIKIHKHGTFSFSAWAQGGWHPDPKVRAKKGPVYMARAIRNYDPFQKLVLVNTAQVHETMVNKVVDTELAEA